MDRRQIVFLGAVVAQWLGSPRRLNAQQSRKHRVAFLSVGEAAERQHLVAAFHQGLKERAFVDGEGVEIAFEWAGNDFSRLDALARSLLASHPDILVAGSDFAARVAKATAGDVPVVFIVGSDPVEQGLVESLNRPGRNMTGATFISSELQAKRLEILHEIVPSAVIAVLFNRNNPDSVKSVAKIRAAANMLGRTLINLETSNKENMEHAFIAVSRSDAKAMLLLNDPYFNSQRHLIVALAAKYQIPAMYDLRASVQAGGLISYGASQPDAYRQAGSYVGRILQGAKASDLPVLQPARFEMVINLKTAKALGSELAPMLLARADEVIE